MRKLTVSTFISLDGVIQAPGGPKEDTSGDFNFGGWIVPYSDEAIGRNLQDLMSKPFDLLLGRCTYDIFAGHWPNIPESSASRPMADLFNRIPKHVVTHRPDDLAWENSHGLRGGLAEAIRALKRQGDANLLTFGSATMVRQLLAAGLVDELSLLTYPVMLGRGKRMFGDDAVASSFTLTQSGVTPGGVVIARYVRGGEVRTGSFAEGGK
jgi:dihydrofolate reductase